MQKSVLTKERINKHDFERVRKRFGAAKFRENEKRNPRRGSR